MTADDMKNKDALPVSLCMILRNEAEKLDRCLGGIGSEFGEIIVLDTGSTDGTVDKARSYGAQVFSDEWDDDFSKARNLLREKAQYDWLLWIDGDEYYSHELIREIREKVSGKNVCDGYYIPRRNFFFRTWLRHGGNYPDYQLKLFKKSGSSPYVSRVHEKTRLTGRAGYLSNWIDHHPYDTVASYFQKFNRYTTLDALILHDQNVKVTVINTIKWLVLKPFSRFVRRYVFKRGFADGIPGFFAIVFDVAGYIVRYVKLWELERSQK